MKSESSSRLRNRETRVSIRFYYRSNLCLILMLAIFVFWEGVVLNESNVL